MVALNMKAENHLVLTPAVTSYKMYPSVFEEVEADMTHNLHSISCFET